MIILQIEHEVQNYDAWKRAFDSDPIDRKRSGVTRYQVCRPTDNPDYVVIHLEFESENNAHLALAVLRDLWGKAEGSMMYDPKTRIMNVADSKEY